MANIFHALPAPAANGAGAWVDTSDMGALRSVTVVGNGGVFEPFVTIEFSNNDTPDDGVPLETFFIPGEGTFQVAAMWMRAVVGNYRGGGAPTVSVGSTGDATTAVELVATAGSGTGAGVDTSSLPSFKTIQVEGLFRGQVNILISEDGGTTYSEAFSYQTPGAQTALVQCDHMKVERVGVPGNTPGLPIVWVGATNPPGGGGGGGGGDIDVQEDGVDVVNPATTLNFTGAGVTVTDSGSGVAEINIPGGAGDVVQSARYTATGAEDPNGFQVVFADLDPPIAVDDDTYNALATGGGLTDVEAFDCPVADYTTSGLSVVPTAVPDAGDIIIITVTGGVASTGGGGGGGSGGSGVAVQEDGADVVNPATTMNFTGNGVSVTDAGSGVADITIPNDNDVPVILDTDIAIVSPVYVTAANHVNLANAKDAQGRFCLGFMVTSGSSGSTQMCRTSGPITATSGQWASVNGGAPLVPGTLYWLSDDVEGQIVDTEPSAAGSYTSPVLYAVSTTVAIVRVQLSFGPLVA